MGSRFSDDYWDNYSGDFHDATAELVSEYLPDRGIFLDRDLDGDFSDPEVQEHYEWAVALLEAHEFDAFFLWMDMDYDEISDFWEDYREMYDSA